MFRLLTQLRRWIVDRLWNRPVGPPPPYKASEVVDQFTIIEYHDQEICMTHGEAKLFNNLPRKEKRLQARKFKERLDRGEIVWKTAGGKRIAVKNKDYGNHEERYFKTPAQK